MLIGRYSTKLHSKCADKEEDQVMQNTNVEMLQDTLKILEKGEYQFGEKHHKRIIKCKLSRQQMETVQVLLPEDIEAIRNDKNYKGEFYFGRCGFHCANTDSFTRARQIMSDPLIVGNAGSPKKKPVLVLNFANPVNPGGGVRQGARAQEEDLCRKSSLLLSLESSKARKYYEFNRNLESDLGSDAMIFTPEVEIIKDENGELLEETVVVAVLTCAAPMIIRGKEGLNEKEYRDLLYNRIVGMLQCAAYFGYKELVLGGWGCGAFGNDAKVVAELFYRAMTTKIFHDMVGRALFHCVDFAVLDRTEKQYNFKQFFRYFDHVNFYRDEDRIVLEDARRRKWDAEKYLDRIRGCLFGGAVGDALGYPVEFLKEAEIFAHFGESGITEFCLDEKTGKALISDDTQMTLFTANGLLYGDTRGHLRGIAGEPEFYVETAYQEWLLTQKESYDEWKEGVLKWEKEHHAHFGYLQRHFSWLMNVPELYSRRAPGNTCLSALSERNHNEIHTEYGEVYSRHPVNDSKGCGGIMRVAPVALHFKMDQACGNDTEFIRWVDKKAAEIAAITHGHSLGYMSAAVLVHIINRIVFSKKVMTLREIVLEAKDTAAVIFEGDPHLQELTGIIDLAVELADSSEFAKRTKELEDVGNPKDSDEIRYTENAEKMKRIDIENIHRIGEGWVAEETLGIAIYCALKYQDDFSQGIIAAVNHNGDSDSTGAVTGNILGALLGYQAIEERWKRDLELKEVILEMADDLCHGCQMSEYSSYSDPLWTRKYIYMEWHSI